MMMKKLIVLALCLAALCPAQALAQKKIKHKEKRFEPAARQNLRDYAGRYVGLEDSYVIEVSVGADVTATKVYENGKRAEFSATFAVRVLNGERAFGLLVKNITVELAGLTNTQMFYRRVGE